MILLFFRLIVGINDGSLNNTQYKSVIGLSIDSNDNLYITDNETPAIRYFSTKKEFSQTFISLSNPGIIKNPYNILSSTNGSLVLIIDNSYSIVQQISCTAGYQLSFGVCELIPIQNQYVSNIQVTTLIGNGKKTIQDGNSMNNHTSFQLPAGICIDNYNTVIQTIYLLDVNTLRLLTIDADVTVKTMYTNCK